MIWLRRLLISVAIAGAVGAGGYFLYNTAFISGETAGYDNGYDEGHEIGYALGETEGYREGETDGYQSGKADGYNEGESAGYDAGMGDGYSDGYGEGISAGYEQGYDAGVEDGLGHGYTLRDPTYAEVLAFLGQDKTDENEYDLDDYVCSHFSRDVCNNAEDAGFHCAFVELRYPDSGHAIIAFDTTDQGLVYFDPQYDFVVKPIIGKRFYQCIEPGEGYYFDAPDHDDTIEDILVIW